MRLTWLKEVSIALLEWGILRLLLIWQFHEQLKRKIYSNYPALPYEFKSCFVLRTLRSSTYTVLDKSIRRFSAPFHFLAISSKQMQISTSNFQCLLSHQFPTLYKNLEVFFQGMIGRPQIASRVKSCSVNFNTATDAVFKSRSIGLYDMS